MFVGSLAYADFKAVHFRLHCNKLDDQVAFSLVFDEAEFAFVVVVGETKVAELVGKDFAKVNQAAQLRHVLQHFIEVVDEKLKKSADLCVCITYAVANQSCLSKWHMCGTHNVCCSQVPQIELKTIVDNLIDYKAFDCN